MATLVEHTASLLLGAGLTVAHAAAPHLSACSTESGVLAPELRTRSLMSDASALHSDAHRPEPGTGAVPCGHAVLASERCELQSHDEAPIQCTAPPIARAPPCIAQHHPRTRKKRDSALSGITWAEGPLNAGTGGDTQDSPDEPTLTQDSEPMARRKAAVAGAPSEIPSTVLTEAYARVLRWVRSKKMDYDTAQDIASDVVAHLWERAKDDPRLITSAAARDKFVVGSAKHARLVHLRNERRRQERQAVFAIESRERNYLWMNPEEEVAYFELADAVKALLDVMSAGRRDAFLLVHESGCDYETVAAILDISVEAAESRVCMVRRALRTFLAKYREEGALKAVKKENKGRQNAA